MTDQVDHPQKNHHKSQAQIRKPDPADQIAKKDSRKISSTHRLDDRDVGTDRGLRNRAEEEVWENENASLQDDSYTFDSDNTDSEEGLNDFDQEDVGFKDSDDFI